MGADRKNYVMTVEIAMAREMAYRNKVDTLRPSCSKDPLSFQVPTPASTSNSFLHSTPGFVPNQMPGMLGSEQLARPGPSVSTHSSRKGVWSPNDSGDHISESKPVCNPTKFKDNQKRKAPVNNDQPVQLGSFFCLVCQIDCTTSFNLMMHYNGQRHKAKLGLGQPVRKKPATINVLSTAKDRIYCKFCGIWCKDEYTFRVHLQCKNHINMLKEWEKKKKPM